MSEHKIPCAPRAAADEKFVATEAATGASFAIREMTDEQLHNHLRGSLEQVQVMRHELLNFLSQIETVAKASAIIAYEIDRRARTIAIVSDLSGIRRQ